MYRSISKRWIARAAASVFLGVLGPASAQTPDGRPPANEGVCDVLKAPGITPALYGLCVAYCEAMDGPTSPLAFPSASRQWRVASPKVLKRYRELRTPTDPDMPCVKAECPCWTAAELGQVGRTLDASNRNVYIFSMSSPEFSLYRLQESSLTPPEGGSPTDWVIAGVYVWDMSEFRSTQCQYQCTPLSIFRSHELTLEQADLCRKQINAQRLDLLNSGVNVECPSGYDCP